MLSASQRQGNFQELEVSRPRTWPSRPRTSKCVLEDVIEAKDVLKDSTSATYYILYTRQNWLKAETDDQVFFARTLAEALMQLFSVCKWPTKIIMQRLQKRCRRVIMRRGNGFLLDFRKLSAKLTLLWPCFKLLQVFWLLVMLLTRLRLPTWTLSNFIALSCYKAMNTALYTVHYRNPYLDSIMK